MNAETLYFTCKGALLIIAAAFCGAEQGTVIFAGLASFGAAGLFHVITR